MVDEINYEYPGHYERKQSSPGILSLIFGGTEKEEIVVNNWGGYIC